MTAYDKGRRFEWKTRDDLRDRGFVVFRMAGSAGAGKIDLIAVHPTKEPLWVQCKDNARIGPAEWNTVRQSALWGGGVPILASNGPRGRGVIYEELVADKVPYSRTRPAVPWTFPDIEEA